MRIFVYGWDLVEAKPWAVGVTKKAVDRVNVNFNEIGGSLVLDVNLNFDTREGSRPRFVSLPKWADRTRSRASVTLPVYSWISRPESVPIATSHLLSALVAGAEHMGISKLKLRQKSVQCGIPLVWARSEQHSTECPVVTLLSSIQGLLPLLTSPTDSYGPVGSDVGFDVLSLYIDWRQAAHSPDQFMEFLMRKWEFEQFSWNAVEIEKFLAFADRDPFTAQTHDDAAIAIAFSQYFVDSVVGVETKERALEAIGRQADDRVIAKRGWSVPRERQNSLKVMEDFLTSLG